MILFSEYFNQADFYLFTINTFLCTSNIKQHWYRVLSAVNGWRIGGRGFVRGGPAPLRLGFPSGLRVRQTEPEQSRDGLKHDH